MITLTMRTYFMYVLFQPSASSVTDTIAILSAPNGTNGLHSITVICTIHPNSTADQCMVMAMDDGKVTRTGSMTSYILHIILCIYIIYSTR